MINRSIASIPEGRMGEVRAGEALLRMYQMMLYFLREQMQNYCLLYFTQRRSPHAEAVPPMSFISQLSSVSKEADDFEVRPALKSSS